MDDGLLRAGGGATGAESRPGDVSVPVNATVYPKSTSRFLGPFSDFDMCRDSVSADPGCGPFWHSTFEDAMLWDRTCLENGLIFASAASQNTLNGRRDSG